MKQKKVKQTFNYIDSLTQNDSLKQKIIELFIDTRCAVHGFDGIHCPEEAEYRFELDAYLCDKCYKNFNERKGIFNNENKKS